MGLFDFRPAMPAPANQQEKEELAITYAALILHDNNLPITEENLNAILTAADVKVQPFWPRVFAKLLEGKDSAQIDDIILGGGAAPAVLVVLLPVALKLLLQLKKPNLLKKRKKNLMRIWVSVCSIKFSEYLIKINNCIQSNINI